VKQLQEGSFEREIDLQLFLNDFGG
jgi:hypothetical protein